jgi:putative Mn2+ efflux pump MntP
MKSKQLANVLIKILGLSLCAQSLMHFVTGTFNVYANNRSLFLWSNFVSGAILAVVGLFFIVQSRSVAGCLFKDENE